VTVATVATQEATEAGTVAEVATVAVANAPQPPVAAMTAEEQSAIRARLAQIEKRDLDVIAEVLDQCHADLEARVYFVRQAEIVLRQSIDQSALSRPAP
jgi:hypothetical protein